MYLYVCFCVHLVWSSGMLLALQQVLKGSIDWINFSIDLTKNPIYILFSWKETPRRYKVHFYNSKFCDMLKLTYSARLKSSRTGDFPGVPGDGCPSQGRRNCSLLWDGSLHYVVVDFLPPPHFWHLQVVTSLQQGCTSRRHDLWFSGWLTWKANELSCSHEVECWGFDLMGCDV
jgi:hypothetical protein